MVTTYGYQLVTGGFWLWVRNLGKAKIQELIKNRWALAADHFYYLGNRLFDLSHQAETSRFKEACKTLRGSSRKHFDQ